MRVVDLSSLVQRIGSLYEHRFSSDGERPSWPEIENVLTEGYARALEMERERSRLEREISAVVLAPERDSNVELRALSARHAELDRNVRWLRTLLADLREYGVSVADTI